MRKDLVNISFIVHMRKGCSPVFVFKNNIVLVGQLCSSHLSFLGVGFFSQPSLESESALRAFVCNLFDYCSKVRGPQGLLELSLKEHHPYE